MLIREALRSLRQVRMLGLETTTVVDGEQKGRNQLRLLRRLECSDIVKVEEQEQRDNKSSKS